MHDVNPDHPDQNRRNHDLDDGEILQQQDADQYMILGHSAFLEEKTEGDSENQAQSELAGVASRERGGFWFR
ncbi:hypothetical protein JCM31598_16990 [Desulfonatronum parangueonense]